MSDRVCVSVSYSIVWQNASAMFHFISRVSCQKGPMLTHGRYGPFGRIPSISVFLLFGIRITSSGPF